LLRRREKLVFLSKATATAMAKQVRTELIYFGDAIKKRFCIAEVELKPMKITAIQVKKIVALFCTNKYIYYFQQK
jgi:hypothetical protein